MNADDLKMVMDFADGSLDPTLEDSLFLKLGADEELRQDFKMHMAVKNAVRTGASAFVLPAASKAAVFSKLGLSVPAATSVSTGALAGLTALILRKRTIAAAGLLIFATAMFFILNNQSNNPGDSNFISNKITSISENSPIPAISSIEGKKTTEIVKRNVGTKEIIDSKNNDISHNDEPIAYPSEPVRLINTSSFQNSGISLSTERHMLSNNIDARYNAPDMVLQDNKIPLSIEFTGSAVRSTSQPTIEPAKLSGLNNLGIGLFYNLTDNLHLGANMRQETFFLRYRGTEGAEEFIYEQQPNFTTFGLQARYSLESWNGFSPYAQVNACINSIGFVGRASAGLQYSILSNFSVVLGIEYGHLIYTHQNNYFNSSKFGLNYGLMYSF